MFARSSKVALTFLCLVVALGLATVSEANSLVHPARDHNELSRMIRKRSPQLFPITPIVGAEGDPAGNKVSTDTSATSTATSTGTTSAATSTATTSSSSAATSNTSASVTSTSSVATSTTSGTSSTSDSTTSQSSSTTSSSSSSSSSSTTSSSSSSSTTTSATPTPTDSLTFTQAPGPDTQESASRHTSTRSVTVTDSSAQAEQTSANATGASKAPDNNKITRTTIIVIAVIASTLGSIALAWTVFRKWKLRPSSSFDDRMQPIDWQPTAPEDGIVPSHRRAGSNASHGSFQSSGHGHAAPNLQPLPEHDFTAGPATLAPVGGYADLQRGPSPQPSMSELSRGPSMTRPGYDYGVPAHHQGMGGYDYNNGMRY
ncbi:hypothetical protein C8Q78DRAFT_1076368 [Trametes maxima]|nr:hypothetical protein C8Q78DRAFT_1076368 [Trametes maxima]